MVKEPGEQVLSGSFVVAGTGCVRATGAAAIVGHETAGRPGPTSGQHGRARWTGDRLPADSEPAALVVLAEELRQDAAETVRYLLGQGVEIKVLSGDAPRAVAAIARRAGIPLHGDPGMPLG